MPSKCAVLEGVFDAIVFDFDGVILESARIKTEAFRKLFSHYEAKLDRIIDYHEAHAGLSRFVKFDVIYGDILGLPLTSSEKEDLGKKFEDIVVDEVLSCPMVPGAHEALETLSKVVPLVIASGTPVDELRSIVRKRGLERFFSEVHGSPQQKPEIIVSTSERFGWDRQRMMMIGDAMTDYEAAHATGVGYIGRVPSGHKCPFPPGTDIIPDLNELIPALIRKAHQSVRPGGVHE